MGSTSPRDPDSLKRWLTFLRNHREAIAAMDFFTVPTLTFGILYCFFVIGHDRRKILHFNVTRNPDAFWVAQQLREAWAYKQAHRFLLFDRDSKFGADVVSAVREMGSQPTRIAFRSPWQNGIAERWVGSCRRDLLDHVIVLNEPTNGISGDSRQNACALIICPFNGPLVLSLRPAVAAISAGNPCMLKLSEALLATDQLLLELIPKYFEPEAMSAVVGAREVVTQLLELPFDFMFLTGSVGAGKAVMRAAAEHLTPVLLELGGQNPAIVDETANLPDAAKKIVWGAMAWGRQWCTSPGYAVVHESVAEEFVADCKKTVVELYGTDPKTNPDYSRIISPAAVNRLASLIDPKKVVYGGKFDAPARYLDPTILYPVSWSDKMMEDEIFGPLLPVLTYSDLGELLAKIKSLPKPLAGYLFSRDQQAIDRVLQSLRLAGVL